MKANILTLIAILMAVVLLLLNLHLVAWTPVKVAGAVLSGASVAMLVVARLQLGSAFSIKAKAQKLVTTGIYGKIRNPIYVFGALFLLGLAIVLENWILLAVVVALIPMQVGRAHREAEVLREAFGVEYDRYRAQTWF